MNKDDDIKILSHKIAADNFYRTDVYDIEIPKKGTSEKLVLDNRDIFVMKPSVGVLPYFPEEDMVVLIEQFRVAAYLELNSPWSIEIPSGHIDSDETAEQAAHRECQEESRTEVSDLVYITKTMASPSSIRESMKIFCGRIHALPQEKHCGRENEKEHIIIHPMPFRNALDLIKTEGVFNSTATISLLWLQINYDDIRDKWLS